MIEGKGAKRHKLLYGVWFNWLFCFYSSFQVRLKPISWSSGNGFVSGAGGLRFKSRAGQIGHSVANDSPPLLHFSERSCVTHRRNDAEMFGANLLHSSA